MTAIEAERRKRFLEDLMRQRQIQQENVAQQQQALQFQQLARGREFDFQQAQREAALSPIRESVKLAQQLGGTQGAAESLRGFAGQLGRAGIKVPEGPTPEEEAAAAFLGPNVRRFRTFSEAKQPAAQAATSFIQQKIAEGNQIADPFQRARYFESLKTSNPWVKHAAVLGVVMPETSKIDLAQAEEQTKRYNAWLDYIQAIETQAEQSKRQKETIDSQMRIAAGRTPYGPTVQALQAQAQQKDQEQKQLLAKAKDSREELLADSLRKWREGRITKQYWQDIIIPQANKLGYGWDAKAQDFMPLPEASKPGYKAQTLSEQQQRALALYQQAQATATAAGTPPEAKAAAQEYMKYIQGTVFPHVGLSPMGQTMAEQSKQTAATKSRALMAVEREIAQAEAEKRTVLSRRIQGWNELGRLKAIEERLAAARQRRDVLVGNQ